VQRRRRVTATSSSVREERHGHSREFRVLLNSGALALPAGSKKIDQVPVEFLVRLDVCAATVITSNRDTADWLAVFDDALLGQGAVDRFKNNAYDFVINGESYRPRLKSSIEKDGPPPAAPVTKPKPLLRRRKRSRP
jgi:hypothetical protein